MTGLHILQVNGKAVKNLREVVAAVEDCTDEFIRMDLDYNQVRASATPYGVQIIIADCCRRCDLQMLFSRSLVALHRTGCFALCSCSHKN